MAVKIRRIKLLLVVFFILMFLLGVTFTQAAEKYGGLKYCSLGTGFPGGTSYPVGAAIAGLINRHMKDINITGEQSPGSRDIIVLLDKKDMDFGISDSPVSYQGYYGIETFEGQPKDVRGLFLLYVQQVQIVVLKDSDIYRIEDLAGKRVAVGSAGSGSENVAHNVLSTYNIEDTVKKHHLDLTESTIALKDGVIDAGFYSAMIPVSGVVDLAATHDIRILPFEDIMLKKLKEDFGYYVETVVPAGTYRGVDEDVKLMGFGIEVDVRTDLPEDLVYDFLKNLFENLEEIKSAHKAIESISLEHAFKTLIPLHPAAEKYYKELGLID